MEEKNYIKLFSTKSQYDTARDFDYYEPWLSYTEENGKVNYNKTYEEVKNIYKARELTFEILSDGTIVWKGGDNNKTIQYRKNSGSWTNTTTSTAITVADGDIVQFRGSNDNYTERHFSASTCSYKLSGNIMSLFYPDGFSGGTAENLEDDQCFTNLFKGCTGLTDTQYLILLPKRDTRQGAINNGCYEGMFSGCTSLVNGPMELPMEKLTRGCYFAMFAGCTALVNAPEILATEFENEQSYQSCSQMFYGCTNLVNGPSKLMASSDFTYSGVTYNTPESCYYQMFTGCAALKTSPVIYAELLDYFACHEMFSGCTSLESVTCLATMLGGNNETSYATYNWMAGVPTGSARVFAKSPDMTVTSSTSIPSNNAWVRGVHGIPTDWTIIG